MKYKLKNSVLGMQAYFDGSDLDDAIEEAYVWLNSHSWDPDVYNVEVKITDSDGGVFYREIEILHRPYRRGETIARDKGN